MLKGFIKCDQRMLEGALRMLEECFKSAETRCKDVQRVLGVCVKCQEVSKDA